MTDSQSDLDLNEETEQYPFPILSWLAVILVVAVILNQNYFFPKPARAEKDAEQEKPVAASAEPLTLETTMVKLSWGLHIFSASKSEALMKQLKSVEDQGPQQRMAVAMVEAIVVGPQAARTKLEAMKESVKETSLEKSFNIVFDWVKCLETDSNASLDEKTREELARQMGWFASIPGNEPPPDKDGKYWLEHSDTFYGGLVHYALRVSALSILGLCALLAGVALFVFFVVMSSRGPLGPGLARLPEGQALSAVMMQTFAIWLVGYFGLSLLVGLVIVPRFAAGMSGLAAGLLVQVLSLSAAFWPLIRGVPLPVMLEQIGLGKHVGSPREIAFGIMGAIGYWPILFFLILFTGALIQGLPDAERPNHPLNSILPRASRAEWVLAFILATIMAPIVEEIFFRGFLYRHLREASLGAGPGLTMFLSIGISSAVFAMIHPQGALGVPLLSGIAAMLALLRETRDNLTASIAAHSFNNTLVILLISFL